MEHYQPDPTMAPQVGGQLFDVHTVNLRISARALISKLGEDGGAYSRGCLFEGGRLFLFSQTVF